jgi:hypothetical protein
MNRACILAEVLSSTALLVACGSSDDANSGARRDGGTSDAAVTRDADRGLPGEGSIGSDGHKECSPFGKPQCARGQTCCLVHLVGACSDLASCTATTQFECSDTISCPAGNYCCATFKDWPDGGTTATTFCRKSCASPAGAVCRTSADCPAGGVCTALPEGSNSPILSAAVESFSVCSPADSGAGP